MEGSWDASCSKMCTTCFSIYGLAKKIVHGYSSKQVYQGTVKNCVRYITLSASFQCVYNAHSIIFFGNHMTTFLQSDWITTIVAVDTEVIKTFPLVKGLLPPTLCCNNSLCHGIARNSVGDFFFNLWLQSIVKESMVHTKSPNGYLTCKRHVYMYITS